VYLKLHQFAIVNKPYVHRLGEQDLLQEALIALWKATKTYNGRLPFHAYAAVLIQRELFRCIRFRHYLQREETVAEFPIDKIVRDDDPAYSITVRDLVEHVLKVAKKILTRKQYICLMEYCYFSGRYEVKKRKRIAKRLRCSVQTISVYYYQAIQRLRLAFNVLSKEKQLSKSSTC
jgi:RNA polymerase sigma factor (sigma-70 family)